jgi:hypothetical protein
MSAFKDETGKVFDRLTVIEFSHLLKEKAGSRAYWRCECLCGNVVIVSGSNLRFGAVRSCGCLAETNGIETRFKLGTQTRRRPRRSETCSEKK